jgi:hypothetical protein
MKAQLCDITTIRVDAMVNAAASEIAVNACAAFVNEKNLPARSYSLAFPMRICGFTRNYYQKEISLACIHRIAYKR